MGHGGAPRGVLRVPIAKAATTARAATTKEAWAGGFKVGALVPSFCHLTNQNSTIVSACEEIEMESSM